ncbi:glycosyl hydrolases family 18 domain-containing protein [Hirsutella rhossiliensis]|uniref:chitinase n=1 Tax=Hirsutella rhossiliensis TaxID=111463 RepID=A0A9P8N6W7_9HYPO|nr:glycosyl hydrolases family 18 domain-containing protein [Hirsutella rhossiliensis]KAH0968055.1 glycosyl hydrolases family 18 domain-containing protein [Hirsutella rhossiliensis]
MQVQGIMRLTDARALPPTTPRPAVDSNHHHNHHHLPRIITYYQTHHDPHSGQHISLLPLLTQPAISLTHLILAAVHINGDPQALTLNDHPPDHPRFQTLWAELRLLQAAGIKVLAMLGGAARGSYERLDVSAAAPDDDARFEAYYAPLRDLVREKGLDGLDLDVEENMSLAGIIRLIDRLRSDFGPDFIITLAPVAMALLDAEKNLSGFDYEALEVLRGNDIAWYNTQFYCGWGDLSSTYMYDLMLQKGWPAHKIVVGLVTNPANGKGFVPWHMLSAVLAALKRRQQTFGGAMGWEYFNSLPGDAQRPWEWAQHMSSLLRSHALAAPPPTQPSDRAVAATPAEGHEIDPDETGGDPLHVPAPFEYYSDGGHNDD